MYRCIVPQCVQGSSQPSHQSQGPVGRQGSSWRQSHHSSARHWISTRLWPTRVPVRCRLIAITGSRGRLLGLTSGYQSYSEAGTQFPALGYLQHDSLDDTAGKTSQLWRARAGCIHASHSELNYSSGSNKHSAARPTSTRRHLTGSASTVRAGRAEISPAMGSACYSQGKQRVNPDPHLFCYCCRKQLQCKSYCKTTAVTV